MRIVIDTNVVASAVFFGGDSDLLSIENYEGIEILTVADFLDRIEKPE